MIELKELQKEIYKNKVEKGLNIDNIEKEFCLTYGELSEACQAYLKKKSDLGEELADVAIYLLGLSEMLEIDLEKEMINKIEKNKNREYERVEGVMIRTKDA